MCSSVPFHAGHGWEKLLVMYDYLTRAEVVRLAVKLAVQAVAFLACVVAGCTAFGLIITAPFGVPDAVKLARVGFLTLSVIGCAGCWMASGDMLRSAAFLSFKRSLHVKAGK